MGVLEFTHHDTLAFMTAKFEFFNHQTHHTAIVFDLMPAVRVKQVHGDSVITVDSPLNDWVEADAIVTRMPNLPIGIITADCAPILIKANGVIAAAHAGWQGALKGILDKTIEAMDTPPDKIEAYIGPCIAQKSYEVSIGFEEPFLSHNHEAAHFFIAGPHDDKLHFDLAGYCAFRLALCGVKKIHINGTDTLTHAEFHSHRGSATENQRNLSAIMLVEGA